ncbi:MAG: CoA-disulfide reductase [Clostridiales bacterium]|jgi:NADPH-dependent 2,4-dienoyl-CoA reductase/sulfur reductase-like enzyme|nr:CoA-disulfide reductase [Clostridiales bacterium]
MQKPLIVIGGVAAGMSAASKTRRLQPDLPVIVYEKSNFVSYGACGMPYYLSDVITDHNKMVIRTPDYYDKKMGIKVLVGHEVLSIDTSAKRVEVKNLATGEIFTQSYGKLVYAAGARPIVPELPGMGLPGVYSLRTLDDGLILKQKLRDPGVKRVAVIGGGYIGLEVAENLRMMDKEVILVERADRCLVNCDPQFSRAVADELVANQVAVHCGETLEACEGDSRLQAIVTDKGRYPCDLAVLCIGVRPNSELAQKAGISLGFKNAVAVDRQMRTNADDVYAAGDCAETYHRILERNVYIPLGTTANRQGRLAGEAVSGQSGEFAGALGTAVVKVFDIAVAVTGLTEQDAAREGLNVQATAVKTLDHAVYYPNPRRLVTKLVYDSNSSIILGAQIAGYEGVAHRIDILATAISARMTLQQLGEVDMCYAPPYKGVWEAVVVAANVAQSEWEQRVSALYPKK